MNEFSSRQQHFFIPFDLNKEERSLFDRYFRFLDDSGVAAVIKKHEKDPDQGSRKAYRLCGEKEPQRRNGSVKPQKTKA